MRAAVYALLLLATLTLETNAQLSIVPNDTIDQWATERGIYVSKAARAALATVLIQSFQPGVPNDVKATVADAIANKQPLTIGAASGGSQGRIIISSFKGTLSYPAQQGDVREPLSQERVRLALARFPIVSISVQPVPPQNHTVYINNEIADPPNGGMYVVPFGTVYVRVTRSGKEPCTWNGEGGKSRPAEVNCTFD